MDATALGDAMSAYMPEARRNLDRLVRIPSVSFPEHDQAHVRRSAEATAEILEASGLGDVRLIEIDGGNPAVYGELSAPEGRPTVLLYAHHDVQPPGPDDLWSSPPFEPTERDGRLFGRGTSDDKCGIVMHGAAIELMEGAPPVGVRVIVEGEEESTTEHLPQLIGDNREEAETRPGLELIGDGTIGERLWMKPAITVIGIDAPTVAGAYNQLVPTARAKISMRIPPGEDPGRALDALMAHVEASVPWGAEARVIRGDAGEGFAADAGGSVYEAARRALTEAWDHPTVDMGAGGSVPLVAILKRTFPEMEALLTGAGDELSR